MLSCACDDHRQCDRIVKRSKDVVLAGTTCSVRKSFLAVAWRTKRATCEPPDIQKQDPQGISNVPDVALPFSVRNHLNLAKTCAPATTPFFCVRGPGRSMNPANLPPCPFFHVRRRPAAWNVLRSLIEQIWDIASFCHPCILRKNIPFRFRPSPLGLSDLEVFFVRVESVDRRRSCAKLSKRSR